MIFLNHKLALRDRVSALCRRKAHCSCAVCRIQIAVLVIDVFGQPLFDPKEVQRFFVGRLVGINEDAICDNELAKVE